MELNGSQHIPLARERVWEGLNDPEVLKACIPGCEEVVRVTDDEYGVAMTASVGPVKARFKGKLLMSARVPPMSYALTFEGSGGSAGFGKGQAQVVLEPDGAHTLLTYKASAQVGGKLAQIGSRLVEGVAQKMAGAFFDRFKEVLAAQAPAETEAPEPGEVVPIPVAAPSERPTSLQPWMIIAALLALAAIGALYFGFGRH